MRPPPGEPHVVRVLQRLRFGFGCGLAAASRHLAAGRRAAITANFHLDVRTSDTTGGCPVDTAQREKKAPHPHPHTLSRCQPLPHRRHARLTCDLACPLSCHATPDLRGCGARADRIYTIYSRADTHTHARMFWLIFFRGRSCLSSVPRQRPLAHAPERKCAIHAASPSSKIHMARSDEARSAAPPPSVDRLHARIGQGFAGQP